MLPGYAGVGDGQALLNLRLCSASNWFNRQLQQTTSKQQLVLVPIAARDGRGGGEGRRREARADNDDVRKGQSDCGQQGRRRRIDGVAVLVLALASAECVTVGLWLAAMQSHEAT